jgi:predicted metal-dependent hydrolase
MAATIIIANGINILLRRSARARRMTLRVPRDGGQVILTLPNHAHLSDGQAFAESKAEWLRQATSRQPAPRMVGEGILFPLAGHPVMLTGAAVRTATRDGDRLLLPQGRPMGRVLQAYLKHQAHRQLIVSCDRHAVRLGLPFRTLVLRDTRSRWGSCSADGRLMFSWRLAMAPVQVLDYVAAHEVAHLAHMDHSPRFWARVEQLMPGHAVQRDWLRRNGSDLMAWKFSPPQGD